MCQASVNKAFRKVSHVIFDMDGVLLDTEILYTKATQNIVGKYGKTYTWAEKSLLMGLHGDVVAQKIIQMLDLPLTPEEYLKLAHEQYQLVMPDAELMPDTEIIYKRAIEAIAKPFGKLYTPEIQAKVIGTVEKESSRIAVTEMKLPISVEKFQHQFRAGAHSYFRSNIIPLMPGAEKLVRHLHRHKIPIAVATSSGLESFNLKVSKHKEFFSLFHHVVTGGSDPEVKHGKPAPDVFLVCASRFSDKPKGEDCLVFEDAPNGVAAALAAGMQVVMIPDENVPEELQKGATLKVNSLEEVDLNLFGLPSLSK